MNQRKELDALRLTCAEHQPLQSGWKHDAQALDAVRTKFTDTRAELAKERTRREQADADALRSAVRRDTA